MRECKCCERRLERGGDGSIALAPTRSRGWLRRATGLVEWMVPAAILALIPKCPMCLAAYVTIGTGMAISVPTATHLRIGLISVCVAALAYLTWRKVRAGRIGADGRMPANSRPAG